MIRREPPFAFRCRVVPRFLEMSAEIWEWEIGTAADFPVPRLLLHWHDLLTRLVGAVMHNFDFDAMQRA